MMTEVHTRDRMGRIPLHYAAIDKPVEQMGLAPQRKAEVRQQRVEYKLANVRHQIDSGADVNTKDNEGNTPLHFAVNSDSAEVVKELLDSGADIEATNEKGETPLNIAVGNGIPGSIEIIRLLRERGANPHAEANNGVSPLGFIKMIGNETKRAIFADLL
jgi:ankyrin repeat protein